MTDTKPAVMVDGEPVPIKVGQVWETRSGGEVRIICTDRVAPHWPRPVVGLRTQRRAEIPALWSADGVFGEHDDDRKFDLVRLISPAPEPEPRETTRVWVTLTPVLGGIVISADNKPIVISADLPLARIVLDIPHGVGLGPNGPMHVKVGGERE